MTSGVTRVTCNSVIIDPKTGKFTIEGARFFNDLMARIGGAVAMTNVELETATDAAQAAADAAQADATQALDETAALRVPSYVAMAASGTLTNDRVLTGSTNISLTDGGAGNAVTVALTPNITGSALNMTIQPAAPDALHDAGGLSLNGRDSAAANKDGGFVYINGGLGGSNAFGGGIQIVSGSGKFGGNFFFSAGAGTDGGGDFNTVAGDATDPGGQGGSNYINAGSGTGGGGALGGSNYIIPGGGETTGGSTYLSSYYGANPAIVITDDGANTLVGIFGATPVAQPTTATTAAAFVANAGTAINSASTFDGYTLAKVVKALRNLGILA